MDCKSSVCQESTTFVRRMLQETSSTVDGTDGETTTDTTSVTNTTSTNTTSFDTTTTNTTTNVTEPEQEQEPYDPVSAFNYTCFMCSYKGFAYDQKGCFNQSLLTRRLTSKSITTHKGCFANGYWIKTNNQFVNIPDTSKLSEETTGLWNYSYQCNSTNEEFYLHITNKQSQAN